MLLITAHRELEKLTLTGRQQRVKDALATVLRRPRPRGAVPRAGLPRHRGAVRSRSQERVTGEVRVLPAAGRARSSKGSRSPYSLQGRLRGRLRRGRRRVDRGRRARLLPHAGARPAMLHARAGQGARVKTVLLDKIGSVTAQLPPLPRGPPGRRDPGGGGRRGRGARAQLEEHLQPARAALRPLLAGQARATSSRWRSATARRCSATRATCPTAGRGRRPPEPPQHSAACSACATASTPTSGTLSSARCSARCCTSRTSASASALPAHIGQGALPLGDRLDVRGVPVVAIVGHVA